MKENSLYKILRISEWEDASRTGSIVTEVDQNDGFIHLSTAVQLAATLSFFFQDSDTVDVTRLLTMDTVIDAYPDGSTSVASFHPLPCFCTSPAPCVYERGRVSTQGTLQNGEVGNMTAYMAYATTDVAVAGALAGDDTVIVMSGAGTTSVGGTNADTGEQTFTPDNANNGICVS